MPNLESPGSEFFYFGLDPENPEIPGFGVVIRKQGKNPKKSRDQNLENPGDRDLDLKIPKKFFRDFLSSAYRFSSWDGISRQKPTSELYNINTFKILFGQTENPNIENFQGDGFRSRKEIETHKTFTIHLQKRKSLISQDIALKFIIAREHVLNIKIYDFREANNWFEHFEIK